MIDVHLVVPNGSAWHLYAECVPLRSRERLSTARVSEATLAALPLCKRCVVWRGNESAS